MEVIGQLDDAAVLDLDNVSVSGQLLLVLADLVSQHLHQRVLLPDHPLQLHDLMILVSENIQELTLSKIWLHVNKCLTLLLKIINL